ncbi:MAG: TaqI-like C-terminal specificity domain-containing protein, partial [Chitinophagales bacterium]
NKEKLIKGVQLNKYVLKEQNSQISQGIIEYLDFPIFNKIYKGEKLNHSKNNRIALQGLTGVNENSRIKSTIVDKGYYLANSCNYIIPNDKFDLKFLVALLNSKLLNFIFKSRSTSSNVNGYEIDNLPVIIDKVIQSKFIKVVDQILSLKKSNPEADTSELEAEIDKLVYELYGLSEEEVKIIENK